jgi:hypothetical protein
MSQDEALVMMTWETVCEFLEELPGAERGPPGGREVVRVRGKVMAYPARNSRSRPATAADHEEFVVVKVDPSARRTVA